MKKIVLIAVLLLLAPGSSPGVETSSRDGYVLLQQAERLESGGDVSGAAALREQALSIFRRIALEAQTVEMDAPGLSLAAQEEPEPEHDLTARMLRQQEMILRQQQLILQKIARLDASDASILKTLETMNSDTKLLPRIAGDVEDVRDDTRGIADLESRISDVEDNTRDIPEILSTVDEIDNTTSNLGNLGDAAQEIRDNRDLIEQAISIAEDIKSETDRISDLDSAINEVRDRVDNLEK